MVTPRARAIDHRAGKPAAEPLTAERRPDEEPLHLADIGLEWPEGDAARDVVPDMGEQERPFRRGVGTGQARDFSVEILEIQGKLEGIGVLAKELGDEPDRGCGPRLFDVDRIGTGHAGRSRRSHLTTRAKHEGSNPTGPARGRSTPIAVDASPISRRDYLPRR